MSLEGLFPSTGSFTGSTRNQLISKTQENNAAPKKIDEATISASKAPSKMEPINVSETLLSADTLSEVFAIVAEAKQNISSRTKEFVVMTDDPDVTREVANALEFAVGANVDVIAEGNDILTIEHPTTKGNLANSVTGKYTEIENMGSPKSTGNVFIAA
jgi:hypothetical protein